MGLKRSFKLLSLIRALIKNDYSQSADIMSEMHGLPQKLGQHITLYQGHQLDQYFETLCTTSKASAVNVEKLLLELGQPYDRIEPVAQASIGQVYKVHQGSQMLALKVKYPQVASMIARDFRFLETLLWPIKFLPLKNSGLLQLVGQLKASLLEECDYSCEAKRQDKFNNLFESDQEISVPGVISYNNQAILSHWMEGDSLIKLKGNLEADFVQAYLKFTLVSLKELGMVHSDPHGGNFILRGQGENKPELVVLDFGSVVSFSPNEAAAVRRLLLGEYETEAELIEDLRLLGLEEETLGTYSVVMGDLVSILFEPFYTPREFDFKGWRMQYKLNTIMASRTWDKPLQIPLKLLLLLRTFQGLYFYARSNKLKLNWHQAIRNYWGE